MINNATPTTPDGSAVADALGVLLDEYDQWTAERSALAEAEVHDTASPGQWANSDDTAVALLEGFVAYLRTRPVGQER